MFEPQLLAAVSAAGSAGLRQQQQLQRVDAALLSIISSLKHANSEKSILALCSRAAHWIRLLTRRFPAVSEIGTLETVSPPPAAGLRRPHAQDLQRKENQRWRVETGLKRLRRGGKKAFLGGARLVM